MQKNCGKAYKRKVHVPHSELVQDFWKIILLFNGHLMDGDCAFTIVTREGSAKKKDKNDFIPSIYIPSFTVFLSGTD